MLPLTQTDGAIRQRFAEELADVESRFAAELISDLPCVNSLVGHIERYRGKMLRPTLVLMSGLASGGPGVRLSEAHRVVASVVEMVHMATLVHDDILDNAVVRRHGTTVNHLCGNETAVMLGDYLISHAYNLCCSLNQPMISRVIAQATNTVCEGELLQLANRNNWALDEPTYFKIIRRKTASLCGTCCQLGASLVSAPPQIIERLAEYGEKLGIAFQIIDDLLDLVGAQQTVGKTLGRDLRKGKLTLPLIHCLRTASASQRAYCLQLLGQVAASPPPEDNGHKGDAGDPEEDKAASAMEKIRQEIDGMGSIEYTGARAAQLVEEAQTATQQLPESEAKLLLDDMAEAVLRRNY